MTVQFNKNFERTADAPFITQLLWSATEGGAKRATSENVEEDRDIIYTEPPPEMRLAAKARTYGDIIAELRTKQYSAVIEAAEYRISTDGAFIHRAIETKQFKFCFRNLEDDNEEIPYAVFYKLSEVNNT